MRDREDGTRFGRRAIGGIWVLVLVFATVAAAFAGPWEIERRAFNPPTPEGLPQELVTEDTLTVNTDLADLQTEERPDTSWLGVVLRAALLAAAAAVAVWLALRFLRSAALPNRRDAPYEPTLAVPPQPDPAVLRSGIDDARSRLLAGGETDDAIIAAWLSLEAAAESCGIEPHPARTPTEFTRAVLERTAADPEATSTLLRLYHRARFSDQGCTRDDIATADHCLAALAASWDGVPIGRISP